MLRRFLRRFDARSSDNRFGEVRVGHLHIVPLGDHQLSVVRVLLDVDRTFWYPGNDVEYDPYGSPRRTATADFNRSGAISLQDLFDFISASGSSHPAADINGSGTYTVQDLFDFLTEYYAPDTTPRDRISGRGPISNGAGGLAFTLIDNPYGHCGYYFDEETAAAKVLGPGGGGLYHCRHRVYDPIAGRWLIEDPAGFVDGSNLYEYCAGDSINCFDPAGLIGRETLRNWWYWSTNAVGIQPTRRTELWGTAIASPDYSSHE